MKKLDRNMKEVYTCLNGIYHSFIETELIK